MAKTKKRFIERIKPTGAKDLIRKIILLVCICVFCYSAYNLASIFLEYKSMDDSNKEVEETYVTENTEQKNSYKTIDFEALLARNSIFLILKLVIQLFKEKLMIHIFIVILTKRNLEPVQFLLQVKIKTLLLI